MLDITIIELLKKIESKNTVQSEEAVLQIAMMLEYNSRPQYVGDKIDIDFYQNILKPELLSIKLKPEAQKELILELKKLIMSDKMTPSMFWAAGKVKPESGLSPMLEIMKDLWNKMDAKALSQALAAIDNYLVVDNNGMLQSWIKSELNEKQALIWISQLQKHTDSDVAQKAKTILLKIA